ncbi:E3 ubiquitin-protein ligase SIRP1 [Brachypodium distachyon]|uniref:RING-type E3 ubiquitin transferase n=1 Tax=Brachypodium distachyon TaxID=15368 RepID=A0A0Q3FWS0_BRADI|nr:E3 ubiquitin-protein ligase SIRP1 [Brachypodium distachyon]XP_014754691.1 E3 ubiquitin-protein ligase SIRP1 [Brachypodium distachyon]KQK03896.1 hypothetical protein BRADI_2g10520v3 [Brachypodium distachyon]PNT70338.1 hypothetical protein BRADI_2g10520v3 [Brachypodium distachyon]|eukprot:XP_003565656.1 E3 ubiquitin-protein ligase SIRP1 [Brachypodium distachyon]
MGELVVAARYWCHMCATAVSPVGAEIKCPYCSSGFLEEMETARSSMVVSTAAHGHGHGGAAFPAADNAISIWAPIIDSMVGSGGGDHPIVRRGRRGGSNRRTVDAAMAAEDDLDSVDFSRRRRRATAFLRLLQAIRERQLQRLESLGGAHGLEAADHYGGGPFGGRSMFAGAGAGGPVAVGEHGMGMALGDYFLGPGLDALMQQLAENDAGRQGTPPAKKEAVEALPTVEVVGAGAGDDDGDGAATCAVCLDDYAPGECARELPCRHRFHSKCILPWLQMHSSCPVCRFQLPADDDHKTSCGNGSASNGGSSYVTFVSGDVSDNGSGNENGDGGGAEAEDAGNDEAAESEGGVELDAEAEGNVSRLPASIQWLNSLFTQQGQGPGPSPPSTSAAGSSSRQFEED